MLFPWDLKWYSGTLAETGPEWYCGPFSGILSGIQGLNGVDRP